MAKFFCDLTNQCFALSMRDRSEPLHRLTQDNHEPVEIHLLRPAYSIRWPFSYDPLSGSGTLQFPVVTLCNPGATLSSELTLTSPSQLTPDRNRFVGTIDLATTEIAAYLRNLPERIAILSIDAVENDLPRTLFRAPVFIRAHAIAGAPTSSFELAGAGDPIAIIAAGTTDLAPSADFIQWFQLANVTPGGAPFTHKITLDSARALPGATFTVQVVIPASAFPPTIQIFDNSISGALLDTIDGDTDNPVTYRSEAVLVDNSWTKENAAFL
jgi:hypothetical protein